MCVVESVLACRRLNATDLDVCHGLGPGGSSRVVVMEVLRVVGLVVLDIMGVVRWGHSRRGSWSFVCHGDGRFDEAKRRKQIECDIKRKCFTAVEREKERNKSSTEGFVGNN